MANAEARKRKRENQRKRRVALLVDTARSGQLDGWAQCSPYHYQRTIKGFLVNWWPSRRKCQIMREIYAVSSEQEMLDIINNLPTKEGSPNDEK